MDHRTVGRLIVFGTSLCLLPYGAMGAVTAAAHSREQRNQGWALVDCDKEQPGALQRAIDRARPGDTILVSGTCNENVTLPEEKGGITLHGGGHATVHGLDATSSTISVRAPGATITGFVITGGLMESMWVVVGLQSLTAIPSATADGSG